MGVWVMISTAGSSKEASLIAKELVQEKLAACVTVIPGATSYFSWEGKLARERETVILVKTTDRKANIIINKIKKIHSYQVPEMLFFQAKAGEKRYLRWVERNTRNGK